jgi:hypothetical protein
VSNHIIDTVFQPAISAKLADLRLLLDLEKRTLQGRRLQLKPAIALQVLREAYPASARRFRDELHMGEENEDGLLAAAMEQDDMVDVSVFETLDESVWSAGEGALTGLDNRSSS